MEKRSAMVTGASQGMGREFAKQLAANDYNVTVVARNESSLVELIGELEKGSHDHLVADLSRTDGMDAVSEKLTSKHFDLLVNNAGFGVFGQFHETDQTKCREMIRLNCEALAVLSHSYLRSAKEGDALINVSGLLGVVPFPGMSEYAATKAFVMSFCESLWYEQKKRGVYVMGLCPGPTSTNFISNAGGQDYMKPPKSFIQTSAEVVGHALRELEKREKPTVYACNKKTRAAFGMLSFIPRKAALSRISLIG